MFKEYSLYNNDNLKSNIKNTSQANIQQQQQQRHNTLDNSSNKILNDVLPMPNNYTFNLSPYPEHTKMTRCNNNFREDNNRVDFFRPIISNPSIPIVNNHENYLYDSNINNVHTNYDLERSSISTRNNNTNSRKPVQADIQTNYYTMNYDILNNNNQDIEMNKYLTRNPVNTRRDNIEKERNNDKNDFLKVQGGMLSNNYSDSQYQPTRKGRNDINCSSYVPMARTLAIPKENI
jgi:hypothetical protein